MACLKRRGKSFYAQFYAGGQQKRVNLNTTSLPSAKEKLRQIESSLYRGEEIQLPTRTAIPDVLERYIDYMKTRKTAKSVERDIYYLRQAFGQVSSSLRLKNVNISAKATKRPASQITRPIETVYFEQVSTSEISEHISARVRRQALAPKTANRYREVLTRLYNWAMQQGGIKMPSDRNPAAAVERYKERASEISFLTSEEIEQQLNGLVFRPELQVMVATLVFAGLRRAEACWLTKADVDFTAGAHGLLRIRAKTINGVHWQPKTGINRVVPISSRLRKYLNTYKSSADPWYFPSPEGHLWDPDNFSRYLRNVNLALSLQWGCLDFRHTFGTHLAMKGESLYKISKLMGNSPEICRKHYAALIPEALIDTVEF
jgi:integrase